MAHDYTPKIFFRFAPNDLLKAYFEKRVISVDIPWDDLEEADSEAVYETWQALGTEAREASETEFRAVHDLATEEGIRAIVEEGYYHQCDLGLELERHEGHHAKAFWTLLNYPRVFEVAGLMDRADHLDRRYRRKRTGMPRKQPDVSPAACENLSQVIAAYYQDREGRGRRCKTDTFLRGGRYHYFFAYPEDYAGKFMGFSSEGQFDIRPQQPAFEVVFNYDPEDGTLELYARGDKRLKNDLQVLFARVILHEEIEPEERGVQPYELEGLKRRDFPFTPRPASGLMAVRVRGLRLAVRGNPSRRITVEGDLARSHQDLYDLMDQALDAQKLPLANVDVIQAMLRAEFAPVNGRTKGRPFVISKDSCNLRENPQDLAIKECLRLSNIARV